MFDHFLSNLLKVVILLDVLGVVAYFLLGAMRRRKIEEGSGELLGASVAPAGGMSSSNPFWEEDLSSEHEHVPVATRPCHSVFDRLRRRLRRLSPKTFPASPRRSSSKLSMDEALLSLRRVLNSYREGLV